MRLNARRDIYLDLTTVIEQMVIKCAQIMYSYNSNNSERYISLLSEVEPLTHQFRLSLAKAKIK